MKAFVQCLVTGWLTAAGLLLPRINMFTSSERHQAATTASKVVAIIQHTATSKMVCRLAFRLTTTSTQRLQICQPTVQHRHLLVLDCVMDGRHRINQYRPPSSIHQTAIFAKVMKVPVLFPAYKSGAKDVTKSQTFKQTSLAT